MRQNAISEGIIAVVYCSIFQTESNGINPRSVAETVSKILAFKFNTPPFKNLRKKILFFGTHCTNTARITLSPFAKPPIKIVFFKSSPMGPVSGLYLKQFLRYKRLNLIM